MQCKKEKTENPTMFPTQSKNKIKLAACCRQHWGLNVKR